MDMHSGVGVLFGNSRKLQEPLLVSFGKKGVTAPAVGMGVLVHGCAGPVVLQDVLHVPQLSVPLFSVKAALGRGMSVHFCPPKHAGDQDDVVVMQGNQVALTATPCGNLDYLDTAPMVGTAGVAVASVQQLARAWECHRRLGHVGLSTLVDLCRRGLLDESMPSADVFLQAGKQQACKPCVMVKLCRTVHPSRDPPAPRVLPRVHTDLADLPKGYFAKYVHEATLCLCLDLATKNRKCGGLAQMGAVESNTDWGACAASQE
jgi:hypothetical protein